MAHGFVTLTSKNYLAGGKSENHLKAFSTFINDSILLDKTSGTKNLSFFFHLTCTINRAPLCKYQLGYNKR